MSLNRHCILASAALAAAAAGSASAAFTTGSFTATDDVVSPGTTTYRLFLNFDNPTDKLLAISGDADVRALRWMGISGDSTLIQNAPGLESLQVQDVPFAASGAGDSWVSIGGDVDGGFTDTTFSPGFLGGAAGTSVINGAFFEQLDNGGYFDFDPATAEAGGSVVIAQFTIDSDAVAQYEGTMSWVADGGGDAVVEGFAIVVPGPGVLAMLGLGLVGGRRRRG